MNSLLSLWHYRYALRNLVAYDLKVRYKKSVLGFLWSLINPLVLILTFLVVFKYLWGNKEPNYTVKLFTTILAWRFFSGAVLDGAKSVATRLALVKRVSFPRIVLPATKLISNFVDFVLALGVLAVFFAAARVTVNWPYLPLAVLALVTQIVFSFGLMLLLAGASVFYSDVEFVAGNVLQMLFFLSPVLYSPKLVTEHSMPQALKTIYFLNPVAPWMMAYSSLLPEQEPTGLLPAYYTFLGISVALALVTLVVGVLVFRRIEPSFAKEG
jgi:ABC-type polysaccharide/polyol phosphate export permease